MPVYNDHDYTILNTFDQTYRHTSSITTPFDNDTRNDTRNDTHLTSDGSTTDTTKKKIINNRINSCFQLFILFSGAIMLLYVITYISIFDGVDINNDNTHMCFYYTKTTSCPENYTFIDIPATDTFCDNPRFDYYRGYCIYNNTFCQFSDVCECTDADSIFDIRFIFSTNPVVFLFFALITLPLVAFGFINAFLKWPFPSCINEKNITSNHDLQKCPIILFIIIFITLLVVAIIFPLLTLYHTPTEFCDIVCNQCYYIDGEINAFIENACCANSIINFDGLYSETGYVLYILMMIVFTVSIIVVSTGFFSVVIKH